MTLAIAQHLQPAWQTKADFAIRADLQKHGRPGGAEQLWARRINENNFEVCCIPFFTYGIALGDVVETDDEFIVQAVVKKGGHKTLRMAVADFSLTEQIHIALHEWLDRYGL